MRLQLKKIGPFLQFTLLFQGPKFVTDDEIERIKAKIEEDNRAIAALESNKYGNVVQNFSMRNGSRVHRVNTSLTTDARDENRDTN